MQISVVIPTCNRKARLIALLGYLNRSEYPLHEVIIVDSGEETPLPEDYAGHSIPVQYIRSEKSVCIQRNKGIQKAASPWIFLCDDDMEMQADYFSKLVQHIHAHPEAGAVSGLWLQQEGGEWKAAYPETRGFLLFRKFIFQSGIWGEIRTGKSNGLIRSIKKYYEQRGNRVSKAGWPVNVNFSGNYFITPVYSLGACLVKKDWLLQSPFDETLDPHGIGENYGVAMGFPAVGIHVVNHAIVYHHHEPANRLKKPLQYYRRVLALDYFIKRKKSPAYVKRYWLVWSLVGNTLSFAWSGNRGLAKASLKAITKIVLNKNPYWRAYRANQKVTEPGL